MARDNVNRRDVTSCYVLFRPTFVNCPLILQPPVNSSRLSFLTLVRPAKSWHVQWETNPTGGRVRDPVAWVAFVEETNRMKPTDKAILGMVSESPGRNVSEPRSGLDKKIIRRPSPLWSGEGSMTWRRLTE